MLPVQHWARNFTIQQNDIDYILQLLLEKETPLSTDDLALAIIDNRIQTEADALEEKYKDTEVYTPAGSYEAGQKLVFPHLDFATATVTASRDGNNPEYGAFKVVAVKFDDEDDEREFATNLSTPHKLTEEIVDGDLAASSGQVSTEEIFENSGEAIKEKLESRLSEMDDLVSIARKWFPRGLMLTPNEGHLHLAEAVLDMEGGGPTQTEDILSGIGGLGDYPMSLQIFSLNYAMNQDARFEEVGPSGQVLWHLSRMAPPEVLEVPPELRYAPIPYDRDLLSQNMLNIENEIDDELSPIEIEYATDSGRITLIYPHRRVGSLPLSSRVRHLFPTAQRTSRIWIKLIDAQDGEEFVGWVLPREGYVFGLAPMYRKYSLPIGAFISVERGDQPDEVKIDFSAYRPRTEWIRLIHPTKGDNISFENSKRPIGADYDDLMIVGIDDLQAIDEVIETVHRQNRSLTSLLQTLIPALGKLTPQGTAHIKTIYSAVNVLRRCPPGPIMATLEANPDFENVGDHYWKLTE